MIRDSTSNYKKYHPRKLVKHFGKHLNLWKNYFFNQKVKDRTWGQIFLIVQCCFGYLFAMLTNHSPSLVPENNHLCLLGQGLVRTVHLSYMWHQWGQFGCCWKMHFPGGSFKWLSNWRWLLAGGSVRLSTSREESWASPSGCLGCLPAWRWNTSREKAKSTRLLKARLCRATASFLPWFEKMKK